MAISRWEKSPLKLLCNRIGDGLHGTPSYDNESDVFFINGNNLKNGSIFISNITKKVTNTDFESNYIVLNENSLLLSINGTIGEMAFYNDEKVMLGKSAAYLNFKNGINRFYYYYFQLKDVQRYFHNVATGSTIKNLGLKSIQDFEVPHPPEEEWKPIAKILTDIDKKIELNNKINTELEAMAKLIYDYWFVQFDFPSDSPENKGKPYKSSGGKMVYNEELKREIPEGWGAGNVMYLANLLGGGTPKTTVNKYWGGSIPFFTPADAESDVYCLKTKENITAEGLNSCSSRLYEQGTVFITARGTVGKINIASTDMAMNQSCYALQGKEGVGYEFVYFYAEELVSYVKSKASGSIFKALVTNDFKFTELVIPPLELIDKFIQTVESNFEKLLVNKQENHQLAELRDWLLPMLMNGQVTIKNTKEK
jgi:type I restriction enzyme S subunit